MAVSLSIVGELLVQLLRQHYRVSLPGIGAFVAEHQPASLIHGGKGMLPPTKIITFSATEMWNDGFLEEALAANQKISLDEAKQELAQFTQELQALLKKGKRIEFPNFGILRLTEDDTYVFNKNENINLLPDSFGLLELDIMPLPHNDTPDLATEPPGRAASITPPIMSLTPLTPITTQEREQASSTSSTPSKKCKSCKICWVILVVVLLIIAAFVGLSMYRFYYLQPDVNEEIVATATTPAVTTPVQKPEIPQTSPSTQQQQVEQPRHTVKEQPRHHTTARAESATDAKSKRMNMYHIVLGSFDDEASAKAAMNKQVNENGCSCIIIHTGGQRPWKLSAYRYRSNSEAAEMLNVFKTTDREYVNAWVEKY